MKTKIKIEKKIHLGYTEFEKAKAEGIEMPQLFGKYQYIYSFGKGRISLIELKAYIDKDFWEIYCLEGKLFNDTERFSTKKEAEKRIKELLK